MVAPLIMLAASLVAKKLQDNDQKNAYMQEMRREEAETQMEIAAQRAHRAGDAGYMQTAARGIVGYSQMPPQKSGQMLAQVGTALASQRDAPETSSNTTAPQLRQNEWGDEDENKRNYFNSLA
jgi:uncharacterized protein HemY